MINNEIFQKHKHIHPLIVHRTIEYLKNEKDITCVLSMMPSKFPIVWDEKNKKWINMKNSSKNFIKKYNI